MKRIETTVVIQRPVDEVFAYIVEPANLPEWAPGFLEASWTSEGSIRVGSTSTRVTNFGGRRSESNHIVTEFEPNVLMAVSRKSATMQIVEKFEMETVDGGTRVTIAEEVTTPLFLKPAEWIFARMSEKTIDLYGRAIKRRLEKSDG
jgi:uncharacterized protein YndB with AHSA1/START domain